MYKSVHGGDIYSEQNNSLGKNIVDYSANVNPLGLPVSVKEAIKNSIKNCVNYPDNTVKFNEWVAKIFGFEYKKRISFHKQWCC